MLANKYLNETNEVSFESHLDTIDGFSVKNDDQENIRAICDHIDIFCQKNEFTVIKNIDSYKNIFEDFHETHSILRSVSLETENKVLNDVNLGKSANNFSTFKN